MGKCPDVMLGRKQRGYAVEEETAGVLAFPGPQHVINPTSDVSMNQETPTTDSREKADTLDVLNVFQGIANEGTASINCYLRTSGVDSAPQAETLIVAAMGKIADSAAGELTTAITVSSNSLTVDNTSGVFPKRGVLELRTISGDTEQIYYADVMESTGTPGEYTFTGLVRGYNGTTAVIGEIGDDITVKSRWYAQDTCRPSFSMWLITDTLLQCMTGSSVTQLTVPFQEEDAVELQFTVVGQRVYNAGRSDLAESAVTGATSLIVEDSRAFFVGQRLQNLTKKDDNSASGYAVTAINEAAHTLTIAPGTKTDWAVDDVITWWMPGGEPIGEEVENRDTVVYVAGEELTMLPSDLSISTPVGRVNPIGTRYPGQGIDTTREISMDYVTLAKKDAAIRLRDGFEGTEQRFDAVVGKDEGRKMAFIGPRMKLTTASVGFQDPTVTLTQSGRFLGTGKGENSLQIVLV